MARYVAHDLGQHFSMLEDKLFSLNRYRTFATLSDQEMRDVAQEMIARKPFIYSVMILDETGRIKARVSSNMVYDGTEPLDPVDLQTL